MNTNNRNPVHYEYVLIENNTDSERTYKAVQRLDETQPGTYSGNSSNSSISAPEYKWNINDTKILIDFYKKYVNKIGTFVIKNQKMLWERISGEFQKLEIKVTPNNCLNRWRVVERKYKKIVDDQSKTGRGRKYFEYEANMAEIFGKKKNIHSKILLDSKKLDCLIEVTPGEETQDENITPNVTPILKIAPGSSSTARRIRPKNTTLERCRQDKKAYFDAKLQIEREKLEQLKLRNELIAERNEIMKNFKCNCQCNSIL